MILKHKIHKVCKFICEECGLVFADAIKKDSDWVECPECLSSEEDVSLFLFINLENHQNPVFPCLHSLIETAKDMMKIKIPIPTKHNPNNDTAAKLNTKNAIPMANGTNPIARILS